MALAGQVVTAFLLFFWIGVPMATVMALTDDPNRGIPSWGMLGALAGLNFYPILLGLLYFSAGWTLFIVPAGYFLLFSSIAPVAFGLYVFPLLIRDKLKGIDRRITVRDGKVWVDGRQVSGADPGSFVLLENRRYAKDKNHVYYEGNILEGVDPQQFRRVEGPATWAYRDERNVFIFGKPVREADPETFESINGMHYRDRAHVYCALNAETWIVAGADPGSFASVDLPGMETPYAKDKGAVYYAGKRLEGADPQTFEMLERRVEGADARDKAHSFAQGVMKR